MWDFHHGHNVEGWWQSLNINLHLDIFLTQSRQTASVMSFMCYLHSCPLSMTSHDKSGIINGSTISSNTQHGPAFSHHKQVPGFDSPNLHILIFVSLHFMTYLKHWLKWPKFPSLTLKWINPVIHFSVLLNLTIYFHVSAQVHTTTQVKCTHTS